MAVGGVRRGRCPSPALSGCVQIRTAQSGVYLKSDHPNDVSEGPAWVPSHCPTWSSLIAYAPYSVHPIPCPRTPPTHPPTHRLNTHSDLAALTGATAANGMTRVPQASPSPHPTQGPIQLNWRLIRFRWVSSPTPPLAAATKWDKVGEGQSGGNTTSKVGGKWGTGGGVELRPIRPGRCDAMKWRRDMEIDTKSSCSVHSIFHANSVSFLNTATRQPPAHQDSSLCG